MKYFLGLIYHIIVEIRLLLYEYGFFKSHKFPDCLIISIGNIVIGGTNKTPAVSWLINELDLINKKPCVITRGYNRQQKDMVIVDSQNSADEYTASQIGDEPLSLLHKHPNVSMVVGNNKVKAIEIAINKLDVDIIIMDDGFQSVYVERDIDIVMINAESDYNDYKMIPRGRGRESYKNLARANFIVVNNNHKRSAFVKNVIDVVCVNHSVKKMFSKKSYIMKEENSIIISNKKIGGAGMAVCGIANPQSFLNALNKNNIHVDAQLIYCDHHNYTKHDMQNIYQLMLDKNINTIITTSKDYYKIKSLNVENKKIVVLDMVLNINNNKVLLSEISSLLC